MPGPVPSLLDPRLRGCWLPDPARTPDALAQEIEAALRDGRVTVIKDGRAIRVVRAVLFGVDSFLKIYRTDTPGRRWKYRFRASRAWRAWAAAHTLLRRGIPTPEPLGLLERREGGWPAESIYLCRPVGGALDARQWMERGWASWTPDQRAAAAASLRAYLCAWFRSGMYHADTKASNILVAGGEPPERHPALLAIDLECVDLKRGATRWRILRNLVQLNGSLAHVVDAAERRRFLEALADDFPWLASGWALRIIGAWTARRLGRERRGICGF